MFSIILFIDTLYIDNDGPRPRNNTGDNSMVSKVIFDLNFPTTPQAGFDNECMKNRTKNRVKHGYIDKSMSIEIDIDIDIAL